MIPTIDLDRENFQEIFEKAKNRIPVLYPEWTNYNTADSGIALLELLSWMKEMQEFHMDQIGDRQKQVYLKLLGFQRKKRTAAETIVHCFDVEKEGILERGTGFTAGDITFESQEEVLLYPGKLLGYGEETREEGRCRRLKRERSNLGLSLFGRNPSGGKNICFFFDKAFGKGHVFSMHFLLREDYEVRRTPIPADADFIPLVSLSYSVFTKEGWIACEICGDETFGMLQSGIVRLQMPDKEALPWENGCYALRIMLEEGEYDIPPVLEYLDLNPVRVQQVKAIQNGTEGSVLGVGNGFPGQRFWLGTQGIIGSSAEIEVEDILKKGSFERWEYVDDFWGSGPEDRHFTVDEARDEICFGDGIYGMAPEGEIRFLSGRQTEGKAGNIKKGQLHYEGTQVKFQAVNEANAYGGEDPESIEDCQRRMKKSLKERDYAMTDADYERMIREVPGLMINRTKVIRQKEEPNTVNMVVKPYSPDFTGSLLPAYRSNIMRYMEKRRLLGTKFMISDPVYIPITLYLNLELLAYYREAKEKAEKELYRFFRENQSDFGKPVLGSAVYSFLDSMDCVKRIEAINLDAGGERVERNAGGDVILPANGLAYLKEIHGSYSYTG